MEYKDYYEILGVKREASDAEIKSGIQKACTAIPPRCK